MSEPLDLERLARMVTRDELYVSNWANPQWNETAYSIANDRHDLLAEVDRLRDEIADQAGVEADLRTQLAEAQANLVALGDHPETQWSSESMLCDFTWDRTLLEASHHPQHQCANLPQHSERHRCGCGAQAGLYPWEDLDGAS